MSTKIIVSYDGTANEVDAIALGRVFAQAGSEVSLAYVRHTPETDSAREEIAQREAQGVLDRGVELLGDPGAKRHVVTDRSTPQGLATLAASEGAEVIVFCSEGYSSSLAAASLQDLGLHRATDLVGGFKAWDAAGLPTQPGD